MISAIITLLTALSLAAVAGWFSIVGFTTIYAGAIIPAIIMGAVAECAKVVTTSWLYRNWDYAGILLKAPLILFIAILMAITSMGVFGFLSKAHLDQGASTVNNSAKIEQLNYQISKEQAIIDDASKVINQLDATVSSLLEKDRADRSISVRKSQDQTRKQLRKDISDAQARIDTLNNEKFVYESELRNLELEIGPIKYIAELIYGNDSTNKDITKSAVQIFTLLIVITLDPLAVVLLIAANQTIIRLQKDKIKDTDNRGGVTQYATNNASPIPSMSAPPESNKVTAEYAENEQVSYENTYPSKQETIQKLTGKKETSREPVLVEPAVPWATQEEVLRELVGAGENRTQPLSTNKKVPKAGPESKDRARSLAIKSWLTEFTGDNNVGK